MCACPWSFRILETPLVSPPKSQKCMFRNLCDFCWANSKTNFLFKFWMKSLLANVNHISTAYPLLQSHYMRHGGTCYLSALSWMLVWGFKSSNLPPVVYLPFTNLTFPREETCHIQTVSGRHWDEPLWDYSRTGVWRHLFSAVCCMLCRVGHLLLLKPTTQQSLPLVPACLTG